MSLAIHATLLAAGFQTGTVLGTYAHAETTQDVQHYETAAWNTVYELPGGQTVDVTLRLEERYVKNRCVKFGYTLAGTEIENNCRALFGGMPIPGSVEAPHVPRPAARHFDQWYTDLLDFVCSGGVTLNEQGTQVLRIVLDAQAQEKAEALAKATAHLLKPGQTLARSTFSTERGTLHGTHYMQLRHGEADLGQPILHHARHHYHRDIVTYLGNWYDVLPRVA